ncbi:PhzF family phenazine biosynthesis protein [Chimaeribacter arupi]|uniref:Phenazine biosynthesis protein PhzF family n=1 Tax=Chimaeribacter arupi TaxID=2060066 RepID=A0A2N5EKJ5_9GAMM|nr:PhzF family phenazine biosynthesis protein [Chimaeribacter arupi]PLR47049.1 phenazine biosynthesis protein PhzF family [Chimaeribacter arupi]
MTRQRRFKQIDVFGSTPLRGNPLAVIMESDGLSAADMHAMARWTNLSETTFALPPTDPAADYQVRIFTPDGELPFAGHPTLGTAYALLEAGIVTPRHGKLVQQCGVGLVEVAVQSPRALAFKSPAAQIAPLPEPLRAQVSAALPGGHVAHRAVPQAVSMGIRWLVVKMESAEDVLAVKADVAALAALLAGSGCNGVALYGVHPAGGPAHLEVRALLVEQGALVEDPVTGSANACLARLLQQQDFAGLEAFRQGYQVRQGTCKQRNGCVEIRYADGAPWVGGLCHTVIDGTTAF